MCAKNKGIPEFKLECEIDGVSSKIPTLVANSMTGRLSLLQPYHEGEVMKQVLLNSAQWFRRRYCDA